MKNKIFYDKKGGEKYFSIWWILMMIIVGVSVVGAVSLFYSAGVDVRPLEAEILNDKILNCLNQGGFLSEKVFENNFQVFEECSLNKNLFGEGSYFYLEVSFLDKEEKKIRNPIVEGTGSMKGDCGVLSDKDSKIIAEEYPRCVLKTEPILYYSGGEVRRGIIEILTASNQKGENFL
jgi:hypothetical protein